MPDTRQLLRRITESPRDIVAKYPIRNTAWDFHETDGKFVAEMSDLRGITKLDPWNRPIPTNALTPLRDQENEIYAWNGFVTVEGEQVAIVIFND